MPKKKGSLHSRNGVGFRHANFIIYDMLYDNTDKEYFQLSSDGLNTQGCRTRKLPPDIFASLPLLGVGHSGTLEVEIGTEEKLTFMLGDLNGIS